MLVKTFDQRKLSLLTEMLVILVHHKIVPVGYASLKPDSLELIERVGEWRWTRLTVRQCNRLHARYHNVNKVVTRMFQDAQELDDLSRLAISLLKETYANGDKTEGEFVDQIYDLLWLFRDWTRRLK